MKNVIGPPVTGENFFGREKELAYAWKLINNGNNLLLPSPRRIGKTSFALMLQETARKEGWKTIHLNLEEFDEMQFVKSLTNELIKLSTAEKIKATGKEFLAALSRIKPKLGYEGTEFSYEIEGSPVNVYDEMSKIIDHSKETFIFLDELTILLNYIKKEENGIRRVSKLLHWLRNLRIHKDSKIRWIMCSSVGLANFTHELGLTDSINDLENFNLRSFTPDQSHKMIQLLAANDGLELSEEVRNKILETLKFCIPYFIQVIYGKINSLHMLDDMPINPAIVDKAYRIISTEAHFNTWIERIEKQYGDIQDHAFIVLKHLCQTKSTRAKIVDQVMLKVKDFEATEKIVAKLLYMLKNDGYLIEENGEYRFRSPLIRDFWYNRYVR